jgi:uncharacterized protein (AIM24 family)
MVMMESTLDLKGKMKGGLGSALMRTFANGESFFQQHIEAVRGDGDCLLSPTLPGAMQVVDCGPNSTSSATAPSSRPASGVDLKVRTQSLGNALFAQSGGFFVTETTGSGQVVVSGFGSMSGAGRRAGQGRDHRQLARGGWDSTLRYEISITTGTSGGFLGNLINSQTSGEGIVLRFSGRGKIYVCSRNRAAFKAWMQRRRVNG